MNFLLENNLSRLIFVGWLENSTIPNRWLKFAILLPCLLISLSVFAGNERTELLNRGGMADKVIFQDIGNVRFCEVVVVPDGNGELRLSVREGGAELCHSYGPGVSIANTPSRAIADETAKGNASKTDDSVTEIKNAFYCHLGDLIFLIMVIPAWFTGWFFGEWLTSQKWWPESW